MPRRDLGKQGTASLKLVSLALALMLEIYFYSQDNSITRRVSAIIEIQNIPDNRLIVEPAYADEGIPAHIDLRGPRTLVDQLAMNIHKVRISYPPNQEANFSLDVSYDTLSLPPRVSIVSARPGRLSLRTVELVRKEVEVNLPTSGIVKAGYKLDKIKLFPDRVIIRGPLQEVQKIKKIDLEPFDLTDLDESKRVELRVDVSAENTSTSVNLVGAEIQIVKAEAAEDFKNSNADLSGQAVVPTVAVENNKSGKQALKTKN